MKALHKLTNKAKWEEVGALGPPPRFLKKIELQSKPPQS